MARLRAGVLAALAVGVAALFGPSSPAVSVAGSDPLPPAHDDLANARAITGLELPFSDSLDISAATAEPGEPFQCRNLRHTVWYEFTASRDGDLHVGTVGSTVGPAFVQVYSGPPDADLAQLSPVTCGAAADISFGEGTTYYFQLGYPGGYGDGELVFNLASSGGPSGVSTGSISGAVTEEGTGTPLVDICASVYGVGGGFISFDLTDAFGDYVVPNVPEGDVKVQFFDCSAEPNHLTEWYDDQPDFAAADAVSVSDGATTSGIDASLAIGGSIAGAVTAGGSGTPLPDICVNVYSAGGAWSGGDLTDAFGDYFVGRLTTGDYTIEYFDCAAFPNHFGEWYDDKADFLSADPVGVVEGATTSGIDAALTVGGSISGTVTEEGAGNPIEFACVDVSDLDGNGFGGVTTDEFGAYFVGLLPTGDYKARYADCDFPGTHVPEWYEDRPDFDSADVIPVVQGSDTQIDVALAVGGAISGTIFEEGSGTPLQACAFVYSTFDGFLGQAFADEFGNYSMGGLPTGDYKVEFGCGGFTHLGEWYDNQPNFDSADIVAVTLGADTPEIDGALTPGGSISGAITDEASGDPLASICISVYDLSGGFYGALATNDGFYLFGPLPPNDYKVEFDDCSSASFYVTEWYDDQPDFDSADAVSVVGGVNTINIDAALDRGGSISGTITEDGSGIPLQDICVGTYNTAGTWFGTVLTNGVGDYSVNGLPTDDYKLEIFDCSFNPVHIGEWYDGQTGFDSADPVSVTVGLDTTGIDASLAVGGFVSGAVTEEGSGDPLEGMCVNAYDPTETWAGFDLTDANGQYWIPGLTPEDYRIVFDDCSFDPFHVSEWYDDKPDFNSADEVSVALGSGSSGVDAALTLGGAISGTVTEEGSGTPLEGVCIDFYDLSGAWYSSSITDSQGIYQLDRVPAGDYKTEFRHCSGATHLSEWYDDEVRLGDADTVPVAAGAVTAGVDAALVYCPWPDCDSDAFVNTAEQFMGTEPTLACPLTGRHDGVDNDGDTQTDETGEGTNDEANDAWPPDADDDQDADVGDLIGLFGGGKILIDNQNQLYSERSDMDGDGDLDVGDLIQAFFGKILTDCA
ncbi:MAG: carboxypeptidase regulatory-like domain-containing protein [Dehalococcoidia bacterium]